MSAQARTERAVRRDACLAMNAPTELADLDAAYPTDEQLCIRREDYRRAEQLVTLATLERAEYRARILLDRALDILAAIPDGDMDDDDQAWGSRMYMSWAAAADALGKARRENGMGA